MDSNIDYDHPGFAGGQLEHDDINGPHPPPTPPPPQRTSSILADHNRTHDSSARMSSPQTPRPTSSRDVVRMLSTPVGHSVLNLSTIRSSPKFSFPGRAIYLPKAVTPGPGSYEGTPEGSSRFSSSPRYGFSPPPRDATPLNTPGPGSYQHQPRIGVDGAAANFASMSPRRSPQRKVDVPGPGAHEARSFIGEGPKFTTSGPFVDHSRVQSPGPGSYEHQRGVGVQGPAISMASRKASPNPRRSTTPGPGAHQHRSMMGEGPKYTMSSARSHARTAVPGPGAYDYSGYVSKSGRQVGPKWSVGTSQRTTKVSDGRAMTPGPGQYEKTHHMGIGKDGPKFSHGSPHKDQRRASTPGPGSYGGHYGTFH